MALVLLSGRPGAGKTSYAEWLAAQRGFIHVDTDSEWATWGPLLCIRSAEAAIATANRARDLGPNVVIEWGFKMALLDCVRLLRDAGFDAWWLDGDEAAARQGYVMRRGDAPGVMAAYWTQVREIEAAWADLESFYGDHVIRTVTCVAAYAPHTSVASTMLPSGSP